MAITRLRCECGLLSAVENIHGTLRGAQQIVIEPPKRMFWLPIIVELVIPRPFLESTGVNSSDASVDAINADFVGSQSDNVAMLDVGGMDAAILLVEEPFNEYPEG